jgi:hypothetical protein
MNGPNTYVNGEYALCCGLCERLFPRTVGLSVCTTLPPFQTLAGLPPRAVSSVTPTSLAAADSSVSGRADSPSLQAGNPGLQAGRECDMVLINRR